MDEQPEALAGEQGSFWDARHTILLQLVVFSVVTMLLTIGFERNLYVSSILTVINVLGWNIGILAWCRADSKTRHYALHRKFPLFVVLFGTIAFVYYVFRSRGFWAGLSTLGYSALFVLFATAVSLFFGILLAICIAIVMGPQFLDPPPGVG